MQKIVTDRLRPPDKHDTHGVEQAKALLQTAYDMIDQEMSTKTWAMAMSSPSDCAAAPALFYGNLASPIGARVHAAKYLARLLDRPSYLRTLRKAQPYFAMFPK